MQHLFHEVYDSFEVQYIRFAQAFIVVYCTRSRASFDEVVRFITVILNVKDVDYFPMILVGYVLHTLLLYLRALRFAESKCFGEKTESFFIMLFDPPSPFMLLDRAKCDLVEQREVTWQEGKELAESWNIPFMETRLS